MTDVYLDFDKNSFNDFVVETSDLIENLPVAIMKLEQSPGIQDNLNEVFRILHSIKGLAAFFSFNNMKLVAHRLEDLLSEVKEGNKIINPEIIDALFKGSEIIKRIFEEIAKENFTVELDKTEIEYLEKLNLLKNIPATTLNLDSVFLDFIIFAKDTMIEFQKRNNFPESESFSELADRIFELYDYCYQKNNSVLPQILNNKKKDNKIKEKIFGNGDKYINSELVGRLINLEKICGEVNENRQNEAPPEKCAEFKKNLDTAIKLSDNIPEVFIVLNNIAQEDTAFTSTTGFIGLFADSVREHLSIIKTKIENAEKKSEKNIQQESLSTRKNVESEDSKIAKTFRVEEEKVDDFMNYVGELIIIGETYKYLQRNNEFEKLKKETYSVFKNTNLAFDMLSTNLQKSLLDIRKLSLNTLLKKYPAIVRNLSKELNKKAQLNFQGQDIKVDKSIIEALEVPLTHIIRNSVDHGIENPDQRIKKGKPECGNILIEASLNEKFLTIKIIDDGAGLNLEKIRKKIVDRRMLTETASSELSDKALAGYIYMPGFSTAESVTEVSGRGVGMDAVITTIKSVGGTVDVQSVKDKGITTILTLPLTQTVIVIDGLIVGTNNSHYIIPIDKIIESVPLDKTNISSITGKNRFLKLREEIYPLVILNEVLTESLATSEKIDSRVAVIANDEGKKYALVVDFIYEQTKVVLKPLGPAFKDNGCFSGCAVMGDGRLCLVLNIKNIGAGIA